MSAEYNAYFIFAFTFGRSDNLARVIQNQIRRNGNGENYCAKMFRTHNGRGSLRYGYSMCLKTRVSHDCLKKKQQH